MAKDKQLATVAPGGGELAGPSPYARRYVTEGDRPELIQMPTVHLHQGDISAKEYGEFPKGTLVHSSAKTKLASDTFVLLSGGWIEYSRAADDGKGWEYKTRNRNEVPAADLVWGDGIPPAAMMTWYAPALFVGEETPVAIAVKFKSKDQQQAYSVVAQLEQSRAKMGRSPMLWKYGHKQKENAKGRWLVPQFQPAGEPPESLLKAASMWFDAAATATIAEPGEDFDPDSMG